MTSNPEKSIAEINKKWYYRFIKVVFSIIFLFTLVASTYGFYNENKPNEVFDDDSSYIKCKDGRTLGLKDNGIITLNGYITSYDSDRIKRMCNDVLIGKTSFTPLITNYELVSVTKTEGSIVNAYRYGALAFIVTIVVFELIRRIFYYIVIGKFFPSKS